MLKTLWFDINVNNTTLSDLKVKGQKGLKILWMRDKYWYSWYHGCTYYKVEGYCWAFHKQTSIIIIFEVSFYKNPDDITLKITGRTLNSKTKTYIWINSSIEVRPAKQTSDRLLVFSD